MTRSERIEQAARVLLDAYWNPVKDWEVLEYGCIAALRSALAEPVEAPPEIRTSQEEQDIRLENLTRARAEGFRQGVEAAARRATEDGCCTEEGPCSNDSCQTRWEVADAIRALSPPPAPRTESAPARTEDGERCPDHGTDVERCKCGTTGCGGTGRKS